MQIFSDDDCTKIVLTPGRRYKIEPPDGDFHLGLFIEPNTSVLIDVLPKAAKGDGV